MGSPGGTSEASLSKTKPKDGPAHEGTGKWSYGSDLCGDCKTRSRVSNLRIWGGEQADKIL